VGVETKKSDRSFVVVGGGRDHEEHEGIETRIRKTMSNPRRDIDIVMLTHQLSLVV
jgi:hypothetical protein